MRWPPFSKVPYSASVYARCTRALIFQNVGRYCCVPRTRMGLVVLYMLGHRFFRIFRMCPFLEASRYPQHEYIHIYTSLYIYASIHPYIYIFTSLHFYISLYLNLEISTFHMCVHLTLSISICLYMYMSIYPAASRGGAPCHVNKLRPPDGMCALICAPLYVRVYVSLHVGIYIYGICIRHTYKAYI